MNHDILHIKVVTALKQPWFGGKIILWYQLINVSQYYLLFWTCLQPLIQLTRMYFSLGWNTHFCQVKYLNGFDPIRNNASRECLFIVFYLIFSFCYLVNHMVQFLVLWFSQCKPVLLGSLRSVKYHLYADDTNCIVDIWLWWTQIF